MHLNALYDLMNRRYIDAVLQDSRNENEHYALISMAKNVKCDSIIVADRGYEAYNNIAHLENNGLKYVIRIRTTSESPRNSIFQPIKKQTLLLIFCLQEDKLMN